MNKNQYLAKSSIKNQYNIESLEIHTKKLIDLFEDFLLKYKNKFTQKEIDLIKISCEMHDIGKINYRFQKEMYKKSGLDFKEDKELEKFYKNIKNMPHGILSCCFINEDELKEKYNFNYYDLEILTTSIYNHHNRQFDLEDNEVFEKIIENDLKINAKNYGVKYCSSNGLVNNKIKNGIFQLKPKYMYDFWLKFIIVKGMLNKLDYAASTYLYSKNKIGIDTLELEPFNPESKVKNKIKSFNSDINECQKYMQENKDKNIIVIASTGIGKTEGALLWAEKSKTFYTLPLKVSINAIYERIKKDYYDSKKISFLHSDSKILMRKEEKDVDYQTKYIETRHFVYPLIVCTVDQLFYFVFKSLGTEIFPATLKYSKLIIDEIQAYSPDIIAFIIYGLKVINDIGGKFCIMTATLPPIAEYFIKNTIGEENIKISNKVFYKKNKDGNIIKRHFIKFYENSDFNYDMIIESSKNKKVLIICNTVKHAQKVYNTLKAYNINNINLLHSRFIMKDRRQKEEEIKKFAPTDNMIKRKESYDIWISTQIVEASLDIDFDELHTDMSTADSLLQRMGRVYRNREYDKNVPNVFIYDNEIGLNGSVYDREIYKLTKEFIKEYDNKIFTEEDKQKYINNVYDVKTLKENNSKYYIAIENNLKTLSNFPINGLEQIEARKQFRNINNITVMPNCFYKELDKTFEKYNKASGEEKFYILQYIMEYTINVHHYFYKNCNNKIPYDYIDNIYITQLKYDKNIGLLNEVDDEDEIESRCI